jgi:pilin isopeptide linkage protein
MLAAAVVLLCCVTASQAAGDRDEDSEKLTLSVFCKVDGEDPADGSLTFVLWDEQFNILQRVINLRGYASFAPLHFSAPGRYTYYITQEGGGDLSIVYDAAVYQIVVTAVESGSGIAAKIAEVNRVTGDPAGEARIVETFDPQRGPKFENRTRQVSELPVAEVPRTDGKVGWEQIAVRISGVGLLMLAMDGKHRTRRERARRKL